MQPPDQGLRRSVSDCGGSGGCGGGGAASPILSDKQKMESQFTMDRLRYYCRTCLSKSWESVPESEISIVPVSGGLSNYLFMASLPDSVPTLPDEPKKVLLRIFGEILSQNAESVVLDSVIFALLSEKQMGPRLYGVFKGGRIEEFVANSVPLRRQQLLEPAIHLTISKHLARLHRLEMPLSKEPRFVFKMMQSWLRSVTDLLQGEAGEPTSRDGFNDTPVAAFLADFRVNEEVEWLRDVFQKQFSFPVVFCHNDLQENNILYFADASRRRGFNLQLIDFEYCSYNWRAFDVGNFFNEWTFDYVCSEWPFFTYHPDCHPCPATQLRFWRAYLRWYREPGLDKKVPLFPRRWSRDSDDDEVDGGGPDFAEEQSVSSENCAVAAAAAAGADCQLDTAEEARLLLEAKYGALLSHFFWSVWSLLQACVSSIHFDFKEYAQVRFRLYARLKSELIGKPCGLPSD